MPISITSGKVTAETVGLENVDNTSDANKPVSTAQAAADAAVQAHAIQRANHTGTQPASTISDFVTAVVAAAPPTTDASLLTQGTLADARLSANIARTSDVAAAVAAVVDAAPASLDTLNELAAALSDDANFASTITNALAEKAPTASPTFTGTVSGVTKAMVGLGNADNTSDASKPISTATQAALDGKAASSHVHGSLTNDGLLRSTAQPQSPAPNRVAVTNESGILVAADAMTGIGVVDFAGGGSNPPKIVSVLYGTTASVACVGNDARLSDAREWSADTIAQAEAEAGTATTRRAFTAQRVFQAIAAWWNASAAKTKLDGIASGATANATDAQLRDRSTHTGTQDALTITGLSAVATSGSYNDLTNKPTASADVDLHPFVLSGM